MKKKIASLLLMLTLIMCQMPALVYANDMPADVPPADQQEQTVGQDEQNDLNAQNDQNGQPAGGQMNLANAGDNEEGTDGQNGDDVSKEQTTGSDASGTDETNGGDSKDLSDEAAKGNTPATVPANAGKKMLNDTPMHTKAVYQIWAEAKTGGTINGSIQQQGYSTLFTVNEGGKTCVNDIQTVQLQVGNVITLTAQPKSGYEFRGWSKNWDSTEKTIFDTNATINYTVAENQGDTLTAVFQTDSNTKYLCVGQSAGGSIKATGHPDPYQGAVNFAYATGTEVTLVATPKENYRFAGWYEGVRGQSGYVESRTDTLYSTNATYTFTLNENKNVYAQYIETRTVSFYAQGGTPVPATQTVDKGQKATKPDDPSKEGFHFLGWYEKPGSELTREEVYNPYGGFKFTETPITENKKLYAIWYAGFYGATYDLSAATPKYAETGGKVTFTSVYQQKTDATRVWWDYSNIQGSQITVTAIPEQGSHFVGWAPAILDAKDNMPDTPPSRDKIVSTDSTYTFTFNGKTALAALFERNNVTIKFDTHGATTDTPEDQVILKGGKATAPSTPTKSPFTFAGWYDNANHTGSPVNFSTATFDKDTTLHAAWKKTLLIHVFDKTTKSTTKGGKVKIDGGSPSTFISQQLFEGDSATITAEADTGYRFVGWSTSSDNPAGNIISTEKSYVINNYDGLSQLWAVFEEKPPVLTLHASSIDGDDFVEPIKIEVAKGTTISQALEQYKSGTSLDTELFKRDGYKDSKFRTNKPITDYTSEEGLSGDSVSGDTAINADKDIYYIMYKEIDKVSAGIESPVCGTETSNKSDSAPYDQTNAPTVSVNAGNGYKLFTADSRPYAFWTENGTEMGPFAGIFKGDSTYYAKFKLLADFGYVFSALPTANLDNAEVTLVQVEDAVRPTNLMVGGAVKAVHDWGEWKVVKEPTETEDGLAERRCKVIDCGAYEEEIIPKLTVEYSFTSGDGSTWTRGTADKLNFVVKRNRADETTVDHFKGLKVDGKEVPSSGYAAKAGSVVIDLMPAYLGTLADGDHTLTAVFDDGNKETSASFKILSAADKGSKDKANSNKKGSPATGDEAQMLIWLMILCTAGLALSERIIRRLKNDSADR